MSARKTAFLILPPGAARRAARSALEGLDLEVREASEPYAAALALSEGAADLVVLDLHVYRSRDQAFLKALRRRSPSTRTLLLLPEGRRRAALEALAAGADAYVLSPFDPDELAAVARGLLRPERPLGEARALIRLSDEVAHAVNNPLQVLSLWAEAPPAPRTPPVDPAMRETVGRIRDVVGMLGALGGLRAPVRQALDLGATLRAALDRATRTGALRLEGAAPADGPEAPADAGQLALALDALLACLAALGPKAPLGVRARVIPSGEMGEPQRLQLLALGLSLSPAELEALPTLVLASHPETRRPHPGLALPSAVASLHGGSLELHAVRKGLRVTLALPS